LEPLGAVALPGNLAKNRKKTQLNTWQNGNEGLDQAHRACRPNLSARLCASLQTQGDRNLFLLETRLGHLKGKSPMAFVNVKMREVVLETERPTCPRLPVPRRKPRLNPSKAGPA
jgi:hypothetical protein